MTAYAATALTVTAVAATALGAVMTPAVLGAQRAVRCEPAGRIRSVSFDGSPRFDALSMAANIVTRQPGFASRVLHVGTAPCVDTLEVRRDALRLAILHRQAGWFQATVKIRWVEMRASQCLEEVRLMGSVQGPKGTFLGMRRSIRRGSCSKSALEGTKNTKDVP